MHVYWWHVRGLRAVKVGHADDPRQHVSDFRSEYGLGGKVVRGYKLDSGTDAEWVERQLCRLLETRGFRRIAFQFGNGEEELFALGGRTFADADELLRNAARHIALAEVSNQRKQQRRQVLQVAQAPTPRPQAQETNQAHEKPRPREQPTSAPSPSPVTARLWPYLVGAIVIGGLVTGLRGDGLTLGPRSAELTERNNPPIATAPADGESSAGPLHDDLCTLVNLSDTLIHVICAGSWASMRWNGRWVVDSGHAESDALDFFNASDVARRVVALPSPEPVPRLPEQVEVKPEQTPQSIQPAAPVAPPPQPRPAQAAPRPATAQPQAPRETPPPAAQCTVSRPKPGFQVYLVTCPNSRAMIGRTVDVTTGWTVSESVNGTEAIEFFMKSRYAR
jgi:outer membrane biosynthesis protein TonB